MRVVVVSLATYLLFPKVLSFATDCIYIFLRSCLLLQGHIELCK